VKHVLAISTLYPNAANPRFGTFVARSMETLAARTDWQVSVINPIGLPPLGIAGLSDRYRALQDLPELSEEGGIKVYRPRFTIIPRIGARRNADAIAKAALPVAQAIHAQDPIDLIDAQFFFPDGPAAARIAREMHLPLTIKARGSDITYWGGSGYARRQMRDAARQAAGLLAVSEALGAELTRRLDLTGTPVSVHYTGLDRDRFRPLGHTQLRAQLGRELGLALPRNGPLLASVGALVARKGHDIAIEALALLSGEHPSASLLIVGKGEEESALRRLIEERGLSDRVHLIGSVDHDLLPVILSAADIMVLPTGNEGLANAWVEALACGTPVVTCDVGGARELVTSRLAGRLVDRNAEAVTRGICEVLAHPPDPQDVAALAERFDWSTHAEALARCYDRLIG
jgi:glycosyltransferase involved in cell wall biosynthesis